MIFIKRQDFLNNMNFRTYSRQNPIYEAAVIEQDCIIQTKFGSERALPGDFLVKDSEGYQIISEKDFKLRYKWVNEAQYEASFSDVC